MEEVSLRELSLEDVRDRYSWMCDPEATRYLNVPDKTPPFTIEETQRWMEACIQGSNGYYQRAIVMGDTHAGWVDLKNFDSDSQQAELGICIGDKSYWGKGYGQKALIKMLENGFTQLHLNKIWLRVDIDNIVAIKCYQNTGFKQEKIMKQDRLRKGIYRPI
ncbi:Spermidine N(1)-acetyltransferase [compost metagenome]